MRELLVVAVLGTAAHAQPLPGTADDAAETLAIVPSVVSVPFGGFAVRGAAVEDTVILVDGFEIPTLQHLLGLRSVIPMTMIADGSLKTAPDVSIGRGSTAVSLTTGGHGRDELALSTYDLAWTLRRFGVSGAGRVSTFDMVTDTSYVDAQVEGATPLSSRHVLFGSVVTSKDGSERDGRNVDASFARATAGVAYASRAWRGRFAASSMLADDEARRGDLQRLSFQRITLDTRGDLVRTMPAAAGLTDVEWHLGEQTNLVRHDINVAWPALPREGSPQPQHPGTGDTAARFIGTLWTPDAALWTSLAGNLARSVRATTGVRVDIFGRGDDIATQPRGELLVGVSPRTQLALAAGAYRRAPQHRDELFTDSLHPERTTQVMVRVEHEHQALTLQGNAFYVDRKRLVIRDAADGVLRNTGIGTAYGVELSARLQIRRWFAWATASLSRSRRQDFLRAAVRPSELDQPVRVNAIVTRRGGRWRVGARVQLASGLPTTSIEESVYDADRDVYVPIFGRTYDERLPFRYELDLRVDRTIRLTARVQLHAFLDLQLSTSTLGYAYSFDYKQRAAVTLPIVPFAGLRGTL